MGPFDWDLMATSANVNKTSEGIPLPFFSRYVDAKSAGFNVFHKHWMESIHPFFFPEPVISMVLGLLKVQKKSCVILVPGTNALWVNRLNK